MLGGIDDGRDQRDVQFLPGPSGDPGRAFVLSRRPDSVIELDLSRPGLSPNSYGLAGISEVGAGPSRISVVEVGGQTYVLATCFDAKQLFAIDPRGGLVSVVGGFSGPFEMTYDAAREWLYITDFSTSQIRVVDLGPLATNETPTPVATLGLPVSAGSLTD